ncbi:hypothetical protein DICVIV_09311 [Dictyocaulus viviparus]|uniref:Uncharacterized protein n=1 Tax=Dictyocaulus viviparus TaxID=29172 RepID=A0A0D8XLI9_DICVI|nr:hypothetical protein DICVIV_09311 [Dictyocaulus viviparus]
MNLAETSFFIFRCAMKAYGKQITSKILCDYSNPPFTYLTSSRIPVVISQSCGLLISTSSTVLHFANKHYNSTCYHRILNSSINAVSALRISMKRMSIKSEIGEATYCYLVVESMILYIFPLKYSV